VGLRTVRRNVEVTLIWKKYPEKEYNRLIFKNICSLYNDVDILKLRHFSGPHARFVALWYKGNFAAIFFEGRGVVNQRFSVILDFNTLWPMLAHFCRRGMTHVPIAPSGIWCINIVYYKSRTFAVGDIAMLFKIWSIHHVYHLPVITQWGDVQTLAGSTIKNTHTAICSFMGLINTHMISKKYAA